MSRYLQRPFMESALNRGRSVEQLLPPGETDGQSTVRWLELSRAADGNIELRLNEAIDVGRDDYFDIYGFPPVGDNDELAVRRRVFSSLNEALAAARQLYSASPDRFVNEGVTQDEYRDSR